MSDQKNWKSLYTIGGIAALLAALLFRRNIGAEVSLFIGVEAIPTSIAEWFMLLRESPFIALSLLAVFDLANYILVGMVLLALTAAYWQTKRDIAALALACGLIGVALNLVSNISLTMLSLSQSYTAAAEEQKQVLLNAGQTILAGNDPLGVYPGTAPLVSLLLVALAGLLLSILMLRSHRAAAIVGLLASGCDLAYCLAFPFTPIAPVYLLLAAAGLFWMIWHLLVARILLKLAFVN